MRKLTTAFVSLFVASMPAFAIAPGGTVTGTINGEAVALGMVLAARYSARLGYIAADDAERVTAAIAKAGLRSEIAELGLSCTGEKLAAHMLHDKKMDAGTLPFILLRGIGEAFVDKQVQMADVATFLEGELHKA